MINKLWTDVSLENYNNWYPLTGKIIETPQQYINTWPNVNDWFTTFAIRAQNDINAYLDFILSKFPFDSFKDQLIKETLRDMVYVCVEHWVFNRTPIEFNVDATIQFNNGASFSANSIPSINVWDLTPSRMKIWARLTELKQVFLNYSEDELDVDKIDLQAFYTKNQVDELIKEQKAFTLSKQMKLYDDLVDDNENEIYRGAVSKFVNKGYVATEYDKETETMILDWPDEIGTLPPEALQNNPQIGDFIHAATADFSAKQQKRITTNENEITKLNSELIKTNENIDDIKNNWFNIATSPLWKKINNEEIIVNQWYIIDWIYTFMDNNQIFTSVNKLTKTNIRVSGPTKQNHIVIENIDVDIDNVILWFDFNLKKFTTDSSTKNYEPIIYNIYQYQGKGTPTEFIAEDSTEYDYYTKQKTNELLDKKQNINDDNLQTTVKQIVPAINENKSNIDKKMDIEQFPYAFAVNALGTENPNLETTNKTIVGAINELKEKIKDKKFANEYFKYNTETNEISLHDEENSLLCKDLLENNEYKLLKTQNKKLLYAINEILEKQPQPTPSPCPCSKWKEVGTVGKNKWDNWTIKYDFKDNGRYRVYYNWGEYDYVKIMTEFIHNLPVATNEIVSFEDGDNHMVLNMGFSKNLTIYTLKGKGKGKLWKLEELQE